MKNKRIKILPIIFIFSFLCVVNTVMAAIAPDVTEFLPDPADGSAMALQQKMNISILEQALKGIMSTQAVYSITRPSQANLITVANTNNGVVFIKNLKLGDTDSDVLALQKLLNLNVDTLVSVSGAGSPGYETTYFGQKTKTAVIKYQNKHVKEILIPNGLTVGTGYFGASTRAFVNTLQKTVATTTTTNSNVRQPAKITSLEPTHGKDGTLVTIHGSGITRTANKIIAGGVKILNATSTDGKTLAFTMHRSGSIKFPPNMSVASSTYIEEHFKELITGAFPSLKYPVCFSNDNGMSNCAFFTVDF
jgi:peptidoglycan hydrolase-like protein with peptidoglycan-binding domain